MLLQWQESLQSDLKPIVKIQERKQGDRYFLIPQLCLHPSMQHHAPKIVDVIDWNKHIEAYTQAHV